MDLHGKIMNLLPKLTLPEAQTAHTKAYLEGHRDAAALASTHEADINALRTDAARYRWIKSRRGLTLKTDGSKWTRPDGSRFVATHFLAEGGKQHAPADSLDAVIDAAMDAD